MRSSGLALRLVGCAALAFVGYFIAAAIGWPGRLDAMVLERAVVGIALFIVAVLLAVASVQSWRVGRRAARRPPPPGLRLDDPPSHDEAVEDGGVASLLDAGDGLFAEGKAQSALAPYAEALALAQGQYDAAPGARSGDVLVRALNAIADCHRASGRLEPAAEFYERALRLHTALLAAAPADPARRRAVSLLLERLGDVRMAGGQTARGLSLYRESLPIARSLVEAHPDEPIYRAGFEATTRRIAELEVQPAP